MINVRVVHFFRLVQTCNMKNVGHYIRYRTWYTVYSNLLRRSVTNSLVHFSTTYKSYQDISVLGLSSKKGVSYVDPICCLSVRTGILPDIMFRTNEIRLTFY